MRGKYSVHTSVLLSLPSEICPLLNVWPVERERGRGQKKMFEIERNNCV